MFRVAEQVPVPLPDLWLALGHSSPSAWLDIETTGLSPRTSHVTLVGYILPAVRGRKLVQMFADAPEEEAQVLRVAFKDIGRATTVITFNGRRFDLPYLQHRSVACGVQMPMLRLRDLLDDAIAWDPARRVVPDHRLQTLMRYFGLDRQDEHMGRDMVAAYRRWLERHLQEDRQCILDHNADDLLQLPELTARLMRPGNDVRQPG
ncbi:MAG: ribonuclease H-like domain-containing protein [Thermaerobacter sp.]|nr:ribonuclease H-like domain-containing protein [Thermaerobacter sp.]